MIWVCGFYYDTDKWVELWEGTEGEVRAFHAGITMNCDVLDHYKVRAIAKSTPHGPGGQPFWTAYNEAGGD